MLCVVPGVSRVHDFVSVLLPVLSIIAGVLGDDASRVGVLEAPLEYPHDHHGALFHGQQKREGVRNLRSGNKGTLLPVRERITTKQRTLRRTEYLADAHDLGQLLRRRPRAFKQHARGDVGVARVGPEARCSSSSSRDLILWPQSKEGQASRTTALPERRRRVPRFRF